jgi:hypothetical protein
MSEAMKVPQINKSNNSKEPRQRYFSFHIKGWTTVDPMQMSLTSIAEEIEEGSGFLTLVEVVRTEDSLAAIDDEDVRECFENIQAAKRLIQNAHRLPNRLFDELCSALQDAEQALPRKTVAPVTLPMNDKAAARERPWP